MAVCNVGAQQGEEVAGAAPVGDLRAGSPVLFLPSQATSTLPHVSHGLALSPAVGDLRLLMLSMRSTVELIRQGLSPCMRIVKGS